MIGPGSGWRWRGCEKRASPKVGGKRRGAWQSTVGISVIVIICPLSTPLSPTMDTRCPPPRPDLVSLRFQVILLQIEGPGANVLCPSTALLSNPLGCCTVRCPESELQFVGCHLGVGTEALKATAGQQAAAAVTVVLTCLSFSKALNSFPGRHPGWSAPAYPPAFCIARQWMAQLHPVLHVQVRHP